jgi:ABC-2 type transport system ATP-binding protein
VSALAFNHVFFGYGRRRSVLEDLSFEFRDGSTLLLGPNGAGKSTMLGLAASALKPDAGEVLMDGISASGGSLREYRRRLSWMPQHIRPMPGLSVREQVAYAGWLKGMSKAAAWDRSRHSLEQVGLAQNADRRPRDLSGGELRRLGVAQTLVHDARWLLMDEPTAGLDPAQRMDFQNLVSELRESVQLVISTHQTEDIDSNYDWVVVLNEGRVRFSQSTGNFLRLGEGSPNPVVSAYRQALTELGTAS